MTGTRVVLVLSSIALALLLAACQINTGPGQPGGKDAKDGGPTATPGEDPAEVALKPLNGKVKRDANLPDNPVVEVTLFKDGVTDADFKELAQFDKLRKLEVRRGKYTGTGLKELAGLPLEDLRLGDPLNDEGLKELAKFKSLRVLELHGAKITDAGLPPLAALENLEELTISSNFEVKDVGLSKALSGMKKLRKLDVNNSSVGDGAMKALAACPEVRVLHLYGSRVTDAGYKYVGQMKHLQELKTSYDITDKGLAELAGLKELTSLSVWNSSVTYEGLKASPLLKQLKDLGIGGAVSRITADQVEKLREAAPNCNISTR